MKNCENNTDWKKIALFLKIGLIGACIILAGDMLMGWGVKDTDIVGIESQISHYRIISDSRMFWASIAGMAGVPIAVVGHFGIYRLIRPYSEKYARLYGIGIAGFLAFGGAGVHVSSVETAFFYKYMTLAGQSAALADTIKFASYFLIPLYIVMIACWLIMVYAHIKAVSGGLSPLPRWCWIFSMLTGTLVFSLVGLCGNYRIVNAIMVGAFSLGNIWSLAGHLIMLKKIEKYK